MQTAKSVQLVDGNNVNISPMTDLMSIYYEVVTDQNVVARKYIYNDFPCGVVYQDNVISGVFADKTTYQSKINISNDQKLKYLDSAGNKYDIMVSDISIHKLTGTNYNVAVSDTYNLSDILFHYESKYAFDSSFVELSNMANSLSQANMTYFDNIKAGLDASIWNINSSISNCNSQITAANNKITVITQTYGQNGIQSYADLAVTVSAKALVTNKIYGMYYNPLTAGINIRGTQQIVRKAGQYDQYIFYLKAIAPDKFSSYVQQVSGMSNQQIIDLDWEIQYDFTNDCIIWMKDGLLNEAPYDFKHLTVEINNVDYYTFSYNNNGNIEDMSSNGFVYNNIISKNGDQVVNMPVIYSKSQIMNNNIDTNSSVLICDDIVLNNNIYDSIIQTECIHEPALNQENLCNNNIKDSNIILYNPYNQGYFNELNKCRIINSYISIIGANYDIAAKINQCDIVNSSLYNDDQSNILYNIYNINIYNSDITIPSLLSSQTLKNNVIVNVNNKMSKTGQLTPWEMSYSDKFVNNQDIYANSFNQI